MRLSCALVSSFLFVSAVLAGYHPEKQQPPFLNRVERSIFNSTIHFQSDGEAGITWTTGEKVEAVAGVFTIPDLVEGDGGFSIFNIMAAIGSSNCKDVIVGAGIMVMVYPGIVSYQSFASWDSGDTTYSRKPIFAGDEIRVSVQVINPTTASVTLFEVGGEGTGWDWVVSVGGPAQDSGCKQDVGKWIVDGNNLPEIDPVIVRDMSVTLEGSTSQTVPRRPNINVVTRYLDRIETSVMFYRDFVIIVYIPPPPPPG